MGDYKKGGSDEEAQGLLGMATTSLQNVAEKAGVNVGNMRAAHQVSQISRERWITFFALIGFGGLLMALSFASLPLILIMPQKFALVFTSGSVCILGGLSSLKG